MAEPLAPLAAKSNVQAMALWPSSCYWGISGYGFLARCDGGGGTYRSKGKCSNGKMVYGSWRGIGSNSFVACPSGTHQVVGTAGIDVRSD